jgi:hypothetical protein
MELRLKLCLLFCHSRGSAPSVRVLPVPLCARRLHVLPSPPLPPHQRP